MKKLYHVFSMVLLALGFNTIQAEVSPYAIATASNNADSNELLIYDAEGKLLQSLATKGKGGVPPHIVGGGIAKNDRFVAVINYGSQSVSLFKQQENSFKLLQVIPTISKPVSLAFGHNHLYVLGTTTIESHKLNGDSVVERPDGSSRLLVADGSAAQVGVLTKQLIISERSNMIELVELLDGVVTEKISPVQLPPPPGNDTPVGLATRGAAAYVTIAHSDKVGLVKYGKLIKVISSETQHAPCWLTLMGSWLFCSNTPSKSISRYQVSEDSLVLDELIAAKTQGEPTDIDAEEGIVAVLELGAGTKVSRFHADSNGNLKLINSTSTANTANGIAIIKLQR